MFGHCIWHHLLLLQAYIQYMRFARRAEGIKAARAVFKLAREDQRTKYQLYVAAALMEYYCSKVCYSHAHFLVLFHKASLGIQVSRIQD